MKLHKSQINNDWQKAIYYVFTMPIEFSLSDVIRKTNGFFYKFQTRLGDVERDHGQIVTKERYNYVTKDGTHKHYYKYTPSVSKERLIELFNKYKR